jgi:hypothetical protein
MIDLIQDQLKTILKDPRDLEIAQKIIKLIDKHYRVLFIGRIGSHAHGTQTEKSDDDFKIVYSIKPEKFAEIREQYSGINIIRTEEDRKLLSDDFRRKNDHIIFDVESEELNDILSKHVVHTLKYNRLNTDELKFDCEAIEIGHWMKQLRKSNSNPLELLYLPDVAVVYKSIAFQKMIDNRDQFITLESKDPFLSYSFEQVRKMQSDNKKFNIDPETMKERKTPLHFIKVYEGKKEIPLIEWLDKNKLDQKFCGIVHIPHNHKKMLEFTKCHGKDIDVWYNLSFHLSKQLQLLAASGHNNNLKKQKGNSYRYTLTYALFYDENAEKRFGDRNLSDEEVSKLKKKYKGTFKGYKGILKETEEGKLTSNELRVSSIPKDEKLIAILSYDKNGYSTYCKEYKSFWDWEINKNKERYQTNLEHGQNIDCYLEEETEFLTQFGWKRFDEIVKFNYRLATLDENKKLIYQNYTDIFDDNYSGLLYKYKSRYTNFSVTPNHKLYLSNCHRNPATNFSIKYADKKSDWNLETVDSYMKSKRSFKHVLLTPYNFSEKEEFFSDDLIKIIGAYLSDGSLSINNEKILGFQISQNIDGDLTKILKSTHYNFSEVKDKRKEKAYNFALSNIKLGNFLYDNFNKGSLNKRLPFSFSRELSIRQIDILIKSLLAGDGHYHKKGHSVYYTSNYGLAKDIQLLLFLKGQSTQIYKNINKGGYEKEASEKYQVFIPIEKKNIVAINKNNNWVKEDVENKRVVCFEVPSSILITKNNDKIAIHGNSKNASHAVRIIETYLELIKTGKLRVLREDRADYYIDIKLGRVPLTDILSKCEELKEEIEELYKENPANLPEKIDKDFLNELLMEIRNFSDK